MLFLQASAIMRRMEIEIDKKGIRSALELCAAGAIIVIAAQFIVFRADVFFAPPPEAVVPVPLADSAAILPDENAFYISPASTTPIFLGAKALEKKREALVWEKRDFIVVDQDAAKVSFYNKGALRAAYPIAAAPASGGFFDIPRGFYTVQGKAEDHITKDGRRHFSWAVYLYSNYLIRAALPLRGNAAISRAVQDEAGIALAPADAKALFADVKEGVPALVLRSVSPLQPSFAYFRKSLLPHAVPEVSAASALAADIETGEMLFEKNKNDAYPTASLTKLMTAIVASEEIKPSRVLAVGDEALATYGNSAGLSRGEAFRADDLMHGLILESSNDIAALFQLAVPHFVEKMNAKATDLGLRKTFYDDASGLSQKNITSAADLYILLRRMDATHPELLAISRERVYTAVSSGKKRTHIWRNVNWPAGDKRYLGGKAGFTDESIQTMAGIWNTRMAEYGGRRIAIALMGSRNRVSDVRAIIAYLEKNFVYGFASAADSKSRSASLTGQEGAAIYEAIAR